MKRAVARITEAARAAKMPVMVLVSSMEDAAAMRDLGATAYIVSNDQNFLKSAAKNALETYGDPARWREAPAGGQPDDGTPSRLQPAAQFEPDGRNLSAMITGADRQVKDQWFAKAPTITD